MLNMRKVAKNYCHLSETSFSKICLKFMNEDAVKKFQKIYFSEYSKVAIFPAPKTATRDTANSVKKFPNSWDKKL